MRVIAPDMIMAFLDNFVHGFYTESLQVILILIVIEGLLSVDNAMAIAAMASHLPREQQKKALLWGIVGAYVFRGLVLAAVAWLMHNPWVKWIGSAYLVYLAANHLSIRHKENHNNEAGGHSLRRAGKKGLLATIISIELMDLSLSIDNVVVAVSTIDGAKYIPEEYHIWVVCVGVFIGILALRLVAGWAIGIMRKYPILAQTAFLLVGFVGLQLMVSMALEYVPGSEAFRKIWKSMPLKFSVIVLIIALSLFYASKPKFHAFMQRPVHLFRVACMYVAEAVHIVAWPITKPVSLLFAKLKHSHD